MAHRATRFAEPHRSMPPHKTSRRSGLGVAVPFTLIKMAIAIDLKALPADHPTLAPAGLFRAGAAWPLFKKANAIDEKETPNRAAAAWSIAATPVAPRRCGDCKGTLSSGPGRTRAAWLDSRPCKQLKTGAPRISASANTPDVAMRKPRNTQASQPVGKCDRGETFSHAALLLRHLRRSKLDLGRSRPRLRGHQRAVRKSARAARTDLSGEHSGRQSPRGQDTRPRRARPLMQTALLLSTSKPPAERTTAVPELSGLNRV